MALLESGKKAPDFTAQDQEGNTFKLSELKGSKVVLFFYPEDDSPTCNKETCNLRDNYSALKQAGYKVLGVSPDSVQSHARYVKKFTLPYTLLADPDHKIIQKYGVWGQKQMYGRTYMGIHRVTYLIDERGYIARVIQKVKSATHAEQILAG
jgi:peroxiredoxin Q/BCP